MSPDRKRGRYRLIESRANPMIGGNNKRNQEGDEDEGEDGDGGGDGN